MNNNGQSSQCLICVMHIDFRTMITSMEKQITDEVREVDYQLEAAEKPSLGLWEARSPLRSETDNEILLSWQLALLR